MLLLGAYPVDIFAGAVKVVLYTVVPAAFVSSVPARLIEDFDVVRALGLAGVAGLLRRRRMGHVHPRPAPLHLRLGLDPPMTRAVIFDSRRDG